MRSSVAFLVVGNVWAMARKLAPVPAKNDPLDGTEAILRRLDDVYREVFELRAEVRELRAALSGADAAATTARRDAAKARSEGVLLVHGALPQARRTVVDKVRKDDPLTPEEEAEKKKILRALQNTGLNRVAAAKLLRMPRQTFYRRLGRFGLLGLVGQRGALATMPHGTRYWVHGSVHAEIASKIFWKKFLGFSGRLESAMRLPLLLVVVLVACGSSDDDGLAAVQAQSAGAAGTAAAGASSGAAGIGSGAGGLAVSPGGATGAGGALEGGAPPAGSAGATVAGSPDTEVCIPGTTMECVGPAVCAGAQACLADGSGYGACDCGSAGAGGAPDVGGAGGATSSAGSAGAGGMCTANATCLGDADCAGQKCVQATACEGGCGVIGKCSVDQSPCLVGVSGCICIADPGVCKCDLSHKRYTIGQLDAAKLGKYVVAEACGFGSDLAVADRQVEFGRRHGGELGA